MAHNLNGPPTIILIQGAEPLNLIFANQFKWAPYNNIDSGGRRPHNVMFANQFNRITRVKLRVFILKVAN